MAEAWPERLGRYVTVTGTRAGRFVEFRFAVGDPDTAVDLIMPLAAFDEFCAREAAHVAVAEPGVAAALGRLRLGWVA